MSGPFATAGLAKPRETSNSANNGPLTTRGIAKFTALVALLAILSDAAVGHGLLWENDPYWTYWALSFLLIRRLITRPLHGGREAPELA